MNVESLSALPLQAEKAPVICKSVVVIGNSVMVESEGFGTSTCFSGVL